MIKRVKNYIVNHWRGNHSLAWSWWVNGILVPILLFIAWAFAVISCSDITPETGHIVTISRVSFLTGLLSWTFFVWWFVGTWRCCWKRVTSRSHKRFWPIVAMALLLANIFSYSAYIFANREQIWQDLQEDFLVGIVPEWMWHGEATLTAKGGVLFVDGPIYWGMSQDMETMLNRNPQVRVVSLRSPGGWVEESREIASVIQTHRLDTFVDERCNSACIMVFLSGKERYVAEGAKFGFHQYSSAGSGIVDLTGYTQDILFYENQGVDGVFLRKIVKSLHTHQWIVPTTESLYNAGFFHYLVDDNSELLVYGPQSAKEYFPKHPEKVLGK